MDLIPKTTTKIANGLNDFLKECRTKSKQETSNYNYLRKFFYKTLTFLFFSPNKWKWTHWSIIQNQTKIIIRTRWNPNKIIKPYIAVLIHPLRYFINKSLTRGHFHTRLNEALIIPLYKNEEKDKFTNHRLISLLNSISKVFEKTVRIQV